MGTPLVELLKLREDLHDWLKCLDGPENAGNPINVLSRLDTILASLGQYPGSLKETPKELRSLGDELIRIARKAGWGGVVEGSVWEYLENLVDRHHKLLKALRVLHTVR